jgi:hypothetical protein
MMQKYKKECDKSDYIYPEVVAIIILTFHELFTEPTAEFVGVTRGFFLQSAYPFLK